MKRLSKKEHNAWMDWVLENSGWERPLCRQCGAVVGIYPPNETRLKRDLCLACLVEVRQRP